MAYIPQDARWYLADVVLEFTVEGDPRNVVHVNIHLIEADSPERAYEKAVRLGKECEQAYANADGREVRGTFRGLRDLNVIHEALQDGAELIYEESAGVPENQLSNWLRPKEQLSLFSKRHAKKDRPNYMPKEVANALEGAGFSGEEVEGEA